MAGVAELVELNKWSVASEPETTREAYARIDCGGAENCGCEACFNFANARHLVYNADVLELLEWLGVDPMLEAEARHDSRLGSGRHVYTACFYIVGEISSGPATTVANRGKRCVPSLESAGDGVRVGFSADARDAPEAFRGLPVVRLEVSVVAPWVSNAPEPL
jgi:hypothetical protein